MSNEVAACQACGVSLFEHWRCAICQCFGHENVKARHDDAICKGCDEALARRGARRCKKCGDIKSLAKFPPQHRRCYTCRNRAQAETSRAAHRRWRERNKEAYNEGQRRRYRKNAPTLLPRLRQRYRANHNGVRARILAYREQRRAHYQAYDRLRWRARYHQNRLQIRARASRYYLQKKLAILRGER